MGSSPLNNTRKYLALLVVHSYLLFNSRLGFGTRVARVPNHAVGSSRLLW